MENQKNKPHTKNCYNEYSVMNENGVYLLDLFNDLLEKEIERLFEEGYSRSDIMYSLISTADYILVKKSCYYSAEKRIKERE